MNTYKGPAIAIHPGEILKDELDSREWSQKEFACIINRPEKTISEIIKGKKGITPETAIEISAALGTSPDLWNDMQAKYNLHKAMSKCQEHETIERRARLYGLVPINELITRGYLEATENMSLLESKVCTFLGIDSIKNNFSLAASFRFAKHTVTDQPSVIAWLKIIEFKSNKIKAPAFSAEELKKAIPHIISGIKDASSCGHVVSKLQKMGVKLVFEPSFKGTHIDGAVIYVKGNPVIGMTLRLDRIDNFWFTLLHELGHILLDHKLSYVDLNVNDNSAENLSPNEIKANAWAADHLLSKNAYEQFVVKTKPYFSKAAITAFAETVDVHPSIVIGRLQRDGLVPWQNFRYMLEKVSQFVKF